MHAMVYQWYTPTGHTTPSHPPPSPPSPPFSSSPSLPPPTDDLRHSCSHQFKYHSQTTGVETVAVTKLSVLATPTSEHASFLWTQQADGGVDRYSTAVATTTHSMRHVLTHTCTYIRTHTCTHARTHAHTHLCKHCRVLLSTRNMLWF